MANQPQTRLFDLIQSMTMSEKRFFKISSDRHSIGGKNNYLLLFDLIEGMPEYDDDQVRNAPFVKNASQEKNYLYRIILKSLNAFHASSTTRLKVYDLLSSVEVLKQKGLYEHALKLVVKAQKMAQEHELMREQLVIQEQHEELLLKNLRYEESLDVFKQDSHVLALVENLRKMSELTTKAYSENLSKGVVRGRDDLQILDEVMASPLMKKRSSALSSRARLHQISLALTYNMVSGNSKKLLKEVNGIVAHYEDNLHLIEYTPVGYVSALFILGMAQRDLEMWEDALATCDKLVEVSGKEVRKSQKAVASAFFYSNILALQVHQKVGRFDKALGIVAKIEDSVHGFLPFIGKPQLYDLYFQFCKVFFIQANYKKALKYTNEILNDAQFKERDDFQVTVRLFNLLVHFELGNDFTLDYLSRSTHSYLQKRKKSFQVEKLLVRFLEKYSDNERAEEAEAALEQLMGSIQECAKDEYESRALRHFDFAGWVRSKLERKPLLKVYS